MTEFSNVKGILLDIEGTTSSISFVYDVMFPYAREHMAGYFADHWDGPKLAEARELVAKDADFDSFDAMIKAGDGGGNPQGFLSDHLQSLMDQDIKATGLKQVQGLVWKAGFESGEMQAHVYDDVPGALKSWNEQGKDVRIYSSGSVNAQILFFSHTVSGNLLEQLNGNYDTTTGPKREAESYTKIAEAFELPASEILFISDIVEELDAAKEAGMQTVLSKRPGNKEQREGHGFPETSDFSALKV